LLLSPVTRGNAASLPATTGTVASADGVSIRYETHGSGRPALVLVHGWAGNRRFWDAQIPRFANKYTVVAIDLGGHGESGTNRTDWTMEAFGEDVRAVVEQLDLDRVVLIGHSMSGAVIIEAARRLPGRVAGLVAVDTLHDIEQHISPAQADEHLEPLRADFAAGTYRRVETSMFRPDADANLVRRVAGDMSRLDPAVGLGAMEHLLRYDAAAALARVPVPVRCIDSDLYPVNTEAGWRHAVSFDVTVLRGTGHFVMMEAPDAFNRALDRTLRHLLSERR
jgi:pimeloyl-ACP methyl ester carboxylesterase